METNIHPIKELFTELFTQLEAAETQSLAIVQFLKDEGIATDEKLAPYLDRAGNASSVKWRAARVRMEYLLAPLEKEKKDQDKEKTKEADKQPAENSKSEAAAEKAPAKEANVGSEKPTAAPAPDDTKKTAANSDPAPK